jgi:hypothetical protein
LNRDSVDHRHNKTLYDNREKDCLFCEIKTSDPGRLISENTLAYAIRDGFPVTRAAVRELNVMHGFHEAQKIEHSGAITSIERRIVDVAIKAVAGGQ